MGCTDFLNMSRKRRSTLDPMAKTAFKAKCGGALMKVLQNPGLTTSKGRHNGLSTRKIVCL